MAKRKKPADTLLSADAKAVKKLVPHRAAWPVRALDHLAPLADQPQLRTLCGAVIAVGLVGGDRKLAVTGVRMLAAHTLATWTKNVIKRRVDRTRPRSLHKPGKDHHPAPGGSEAKEETSFPSGHSAGAAAVARAYARAYPDRAAPALAAGAGLALAQIPRCAHYPTDVGAGIAIGLASEKLTDSLFRLAEQRLDPA